MKRFIPSIVLFFVLIILDRITKLIVLSKLTEWPYQYNVAPFFSFSYTENTGIAFGLFQGHPNFFLVTSIFAFIFVGIILWNLFKTNKLTQWYLLSFSSILAGAIGNIWDRIHYGYVVDFLDFYLGSHHWPAFNIADSAITCGLIILIIHSFYDDFKEKRKIVNTDKTNSTDNN